MAKSLKYFLNYFFLSDNLRIIKTMLTISEYSGSLRDRRFFFERLQFLFLIPASILFFRYKNVIVRSNSAFFIEPSGNIEHINMYEFYMVNNFDKNLFHLHYRQGIFISNVVDFLSVLKLFRDIFGLLPFVFSLKKISFLEFWKCFVLEHNLRVLKPKESVYVADYSSICNYIFLLRNSTKYCLSFIPTNSSVFFYFRFLFLRDINLVITSPKILEEVVQLRNRGFIELNNVKFIQTGPLFELYQTDKNPAVVYDIAFYSSGEWARRGGLFRLDNLESIKTAIENGNIYSDVSYQIIDYLSSFAVSRNLTFKVCLHPYEKYLLEKYGLKPLFFKVLENRNVHISFSKYSNLFEARLGVITISSVLFDRESYGLDSLYFIEDPVDRNTVFYKKGQFQDDRNSFVDLVSLQSRLDTYFQLR